MEFSSLLEQMVKDGASDLFVSAEAPPMLKVEGNFRPVGKTALNSAEVYELVYSILSDSQRKSFEETSELNMALRAKGIGRFRINVFRQMGEIVLVARHIKSTIPTVEELGLPPVLKDLVKQPRGLILLVGGTGTGKSTTLAAMIDHRNQTMAGHILTIEDPVEFVYEHKKSLVHQREVGLDTASYEVALKNAMREAPDVILIGEIRDMETMKHAIAYAETGHLCLSTLHANNSNQAIDRIVNFFPEEMHHQILRDLSLNLRAIISQRLPRGVDGKRVAAIEILLNTPYISDLIAKGEVVKIKEAMAQARPQGCQTFDDALFDLIAAGKLGEDEALQHADSRNNLALRLKLEGVKARQQQPPIAKKVAHARFVDFSNYQSYRLKRGDVSSDLADRAEKFEEAFRAVFFQKGLREDHAKPDLEVQYSSATTVETDSASTPEIDNAVESDANIQPACKKYGLLKVNFVDTKTGKVVWQVKASREFALQPRSKSELQADCEFLFADYPPH